MYTMVVYFRGEFFVLSLFGSGSRRKTKLPT